MAAAPAPKPPSTPAPVAAMCDELGQIEKDLGPWRFKIAREEVLRRAIRESYDSADADSPHSPEGAKFLVALGPKGLVSAVDLKALARHIGAKAVYRIAKVTLEALKEFPAVAGLVVTQARTGHRSLKVFEKAT